MNNDGKQLEALISLVEKTLLPQGFEVTQNRREYNAEGDQIAEFDIEVRGKVGSARIAWLIECRDRPSNGKAPNSWIEQLVGRRERFLFNKVTAVSTTGFAPGVEEFANSKGIELREVRSLTPDNFEDWLVVGSFCNHELAHDLAHARLVIFPETNGKQRAELEPLLSNPPGSEPVLIQSKNGEAIRVWDAFVAAVKAYGNLFEDIAPNGPGRSVELQVKYTGDDDHYIVRTALGDVRVGEIVFCGTLRIKETFVPLAAAQEYCDVSTGQVISQVAGFGPHNILGNQFMLEFHHIPNSDTHIMLRNVKTNSSS